MLIKLLCHESVVMDTFCVQDLVQLHALSWILFACIWLCVIVRRMTDAVKHRLGVKAWLLWQG